MQQLDQVLLALFLFLTMFGMGSTLSVPDFRRVLARPRALAIGVASQFVWMPFAAFLLARALGLPDALALGLIVMGCSSGGTTSNLFSYYAGADLALSIAMTVTSTVAALVLMPLALGIYTAPFTGDDLEVPYANVVSTLVAVLVPVAAGVWLRTRRPDWARRAERVGSLAGIAVLVLVFAVSVFRDHERITSFSAAEVFAGTALGPLGFVFGWLGARLLRVPGPQRRAICLETGIQNAPLAIGVIVVSFADAHAQEILRVPLLYGALVVPASAAVAVAFRRATTEAS
ncbi:MAG: bile acid:sodium symporter family protein [Myxococcota bacterium]